METYCQVIYLPAYQLWFYMYLMGMHAALHGDSSIKVIVQKEPITNLIYVTSPNHKIMVGDKERKLTKDSL